MELLTYAGVFNLPTIPIVADVGGGVNTRAGAGGSVFVPTCRLSDTGVSAGAGGSVFVPTCRSSDTGVSAELCSGCSRDSGTSVGSLAGIL